MMNSELLTRLLHDPGRIRPEDSRELSETVEKYPYCQVARALYAYSLYRQNDHRFVAQLRRSAASISSRKKLKVLFESEIPVEVEKKTDLQPAVTLIPHEPDFILTKEDIIEKFIREEPKISRPQGAFYNPNENAIKSSNDDEDIVSETLAQLYKNQGNPAKAIKIYAKLSLLFPEKSRYFAAQIEKLQEK